MNAVLVAILMFALILLALCFFVFLLRWRRFKELLDGSIYDTELHKLLNTKDKEQSDKKMRLCQSCGEHNIDSAKFCKHCGQHLQSELALCPGCGTENAGHSKFCKSCGLRLNDDGSQQSTEPESNGERPT